MTAAGNNRTILVVDDEPHIVRFTAMNLEVEGFRVLTAGNGMEALELLERGEPEPGAAVDLVVLDVMMPELDGFETLRRIRRQSSVPVIFVTVRGDEADRVAGLDLGADDYLTKPFSPRELASRIRALFRRIEAAEPPRLQEVMVDDRLAVNFDQSMVIADGREIHLRPTEYRLLYQLVNNAGQLLSHDTLLERVWGPEYRGEHQYVRTYVTYLRQKLERDPRQPQYILSERGLGYRFKELGR